MKNLFTVDLKTREHGCDEFLIRKSDTELKEQYDKNSKYIGSTLRKKYTPFLIIWFAFFVVGGIVISIFLGNLKDAGFAQTYLSFGWALYVGIASIAVSAIFFLTAIINVRKFMKSPKIQNLLKEQEELEQRIAKSLLIPEDCAEIDIMYRPYKIKKGKVKYQNKSYENLPMRVFTEDENLCLADTFGVWAVPLSDITSIIEFPGRATLSYWNKEEEINSKKYKRKVKYYKGDFFVNGYYSLQLMRGGEEWEVLIPSYDIDCIFELTGKTPAE